MTEKELLSLAKQARGSAYAPYSGFAVGAALLARDGRVFLGCNLENASYSLTLCAERAAIASAVSFGVREFERLALVGGPVGDEPVFCPPCGACLQVLAEFCPPDFPIVWENDGTVTERRLSELLPSAFHLKGENNA